MMLKSSPSYFLCILITHMCSLLFYSSELKPDAEEEQATAFFMWLPGFALDPKLNKKLSVLGTDGNMTRCKFEQSSALPGTISVLH